MTTEPDPDLINDPEADDDENAPAPEGHDLRNLRRNAKAAKRLEKENEALRAQARKLAFYDAGLTAEDLTSPVGQLFSDGYKGELEATAIAEAWGKVSGNAPPPASDEPTPEEQEVHRQRQSLGGGAVGDTGEAPPEPVRGVEGRAVKAGQAILATRTREEAQAATFRALVDAAASGDPSVILPFGGQRQE